MINLDRSDVRTIVFFLIFAFGGVSSLFNTFISASAPLSALSFKWMVVIAGYVFIQLALLAHQIYHTHKSPIQLRLPNWWKNNPFTRSLIIILALYAIGFILTISPLERLIVHTLNSFWLNYPLALLIIIAIRKISDPEGTGTIELFDLINAFFLYIGFFIASPILVFYENVSEWIILSISVMIAIGYSDLKLPKPFIDRLRASKKLKNLFLSILLVGAIYFFLWLSLNAMTASQSIMDEGAYSIKGYLFAIGKYFPYQDFGPWTNKMPLAFMIPGWIQKFFGPSLLSIRVASVILQSITLLNLFILGKRFMGYTGAVLAISLFAFNPAFPSFYAQGNTQILSIFLISTVLVFSIGKDRGTFSLLIGNFIAGILLLSRENMAPFVVLLDLYLIWEFGIKRAALPIITGAGVFVVGHIYYWPGILKVWAKWAPKSLTPFLDEFRQKGGGKLMWKREGRNTDIITTLGSLFQGISSNLVNMIAVSTFPWVLKRGKTLIKDPLFKVFTLLFSSVMILTIIHALITLNDGSCVYCFSSYLSFFTPIAIVLFIVSIRSLSHHPSKLGLSVFVFINGLFFLGDWYNHRQSLRWLTQIKLTSIVNDSGFQFLSDLLQLNFGLEYEISNTLVPVAAGAFLLFAIWLLAIWFWKKFLSPALSTHNALQTAIALSILLPIAANLVFFGTREPACVANVPAGFANGTAKIQQFAQPGQKIFWLGESTAILLGLDNEFYPQQFNEGFGYKVGSDNDLAEAYGFWNENLAREWSQETDIILLEENKSENPIMENVDLGRFVEVGRTEPVNSCDPTSYYHIYQRIK